MFLSITPLVQIITIFVANAIQSLAITNSNQFRRHIDTLSDWEIGLREATHHALVRERLIKHPNLKEYLYSAPLLGRQDTATPFGDIAIIARGQLYSAPGGFQFVQDPYQNDCDGCHNTPLRCDRVPCEYWKPQDHERLLALWSVKRIRHRDPHYGFRYDFEYKISPMSSINGKPFITRNGNFDYSIDGHKFIVQKDNVHDFNPYKHHFLPHDSDQWSPNYHEPNLNEYLPPLLPPIEDEYSDEDRRNQPYGPNGHRDIPHPTTETPIIPFTQDTNKDLHNNGIGTLTTTNTPPMKTTGEAAFLFTTQKPSTQTKIHFLPTRPTVFKEPTPSSTTRTEHTTTPTYYSQTTSQTRYSESTRFIKYSEPDPLYTNSMLTTSTTKFYPTLPPRHTRPPTKITTSDNDYNVELFGEPPTTPRVTSMEFSHPINDYMLFGEHAITVVSPPNIPLKENKFDKTTSPVVTKFTEQKTTTSSYYTQPMTTSSRMTSTELNVKTTEPTKTTKRVFYITKKPLQVTSSSVTSSTATTAKTEDTTVRDKITTGLQEIKTISPTKTDFLDAEQRTTYSTQTTSNNLNTEDNTIDFTISRESTTSATAGVTTTTGYPTDENFETTTQEVQTTEVPTTTISSTTTKKPKSTVRVTTFFPIKTSLIDDKKTSKEVNRLTTNFPLETTAIDDNVFQFNFFGSSNTQPTITSFTSYSTSSSSSDVDDIFGIPIKHIGTDKFQNIEDNAPKVIFSNFFLPSSMYYPTETTSNSVEVEYAEDNLNGTVDPITSQSYITSVSFEVNKKQKDTTTRNSTEPKPTEISAIHNTVVPSIQTPKEARKQITQNSKILDSLTTSVLTHAKYISYLNDEKNENITARPKRYARNKNIKRTKKIKTRKRK